MYQIKNGILYKNGKKTFVFWGSLTTPPFTRQNFRFRPMAIDTAR